jgi:hypothetical protein
VALASRRQVFQSSKIANPAGETLALPKSFLDFKPGEK